MNWNFTITHTKKYVKFQVILHLGLDLPPQFFKLKNTTFFFLNACPLGGIRERKDLTKKTTSDP